MKESVWYVVSLSDITASFLSAHVAVGMTLSQCVCLLLCHLLDYEETLRATSQQLLGLKC